MDISRLKKLVLLAVLVVATVPVTAQSASRAAIEPRTSRETTSSSTPVARLSMELDHGLTLVRAKLQDGRELQLIVDTGASSSVFNESAMEKLGFASRPGGDHAMAMTASGTAQLKFLTEPVKLDLAGASLEFNNAIALPLDDLARRMGRELHGVLGRQLFQKYVVRVDYAGKIMELFDPDGFDAQGAGAEIPVKLRMGSIPAIEAEVTLPDGRVLGGTFVIDSGARTTVSLNKPFVDKHNVLEAVKSSLKTTGHGAATEYEKLVSRLEELRFAGFRVERPLTTLSRSEGGAFSSTSFAGVIGAHALERFVVTWELTRKRMYLQPNSRYDSPDRMIDAGVRFSLGDANEGWFKVREVVERSPAAEQGIEIGDRLLAIDERPSAELTLPEINEILRQDGAAIRLRLARGDEELEVVVEPRELVL